MTDIVLKNRKGEDVTYSGIETVTFDTPTEGEKATFTHGVAVSGVVLELNLAEGDQTVDAGDGILVKSAIIKKPETLLPENIAKDVEIAGVVGTLKSGGGGGVEPYVEYTLNTAGEIIAAKLYGFTAIPPYMFYNLTLLETVDLSESPNITEIGKYAFCTCNGLLSISIPDGVTSIGDYAFQNCSKLTSIIIPDSVISIGSNAFAGCSKMETAVIGSGVTKIDHRAFSTSLSTRLITFKVTSGWWYATSATATSGTAIPESSLADPATANTYLSSTYRNNYWRRT